MYDWTEVVLELGVLFLFLMAVAAASFALWMMFFGG